MNVEQRPLSLSEFINMIRARLELIFLNSLDDAELRRDRTLSEWEMVLYEAYRTSAGGSDE